jgi:hypothetical protein
MTALSPPQRRNPRDFGARRPGMPFPGWRLRELGSSLEVP